MAIQFLNSQNIAGGITTSASSDMAGINMTSGLAMSDNTITSTSYIGRDGHNYITFATDDTIIYRVADSNRARFDSTGLNPYGDSSYDLGTSVLRWKDAYLDNTYSTKVGVATTSINAGIALQVTGTAYFSTGLKVNNISSAYISSSSNMTFETGATGEHVFQCNSADQINIADGVMYPETDSDVDLGKTGQRFSTLWVDSINGGTPGTVTGTGSADRVAFWSSSTGLGSDADLTFDGTILTLGSTGVTSTLKLPNNGLIELYNSNDDKKFTIRNIGASSNTLAIELDDDSDALSISAAGDVTFAGHLIPSADNTIDLGTTDSLDFRTLYIRNIDVYNQRLIIDADGTIARFSDHSSVGDGLQFIHLGTEILRLGNGSSTESTFTGDVTISDVINWGSSRGTLHWGADRAIVRGQSGYALELQSDGGTTVLVLDNSAHATFSGNIILDDGSGNSPYVQFINADNDEWYIQNNSSGKLLFNQNGTTRGTFSSGDLELANALKITTIDEVGSDTDKFLMSDSGTVKYVTGANLASYIGATTGGPYLPLAGGTMTGDVIYNDSIKIKLGTGGGNSDIYHNGTDMYIRNLTTAGDMSFSGDSTGSGGASTAYFWLDGGVVQTRFAKGANFEDSVELSFGNVTDRDLRIYHNTSDSHIDNYTGNLNIVNNTDDGDINFYSDNGSGSVAIYFTVDGTNERVLFNKAVNLSDDVVLQLGSSQDLRLYHDGNNSYILDAGVGSMKVGAENFHLMDASLSEYMMTGTPNEGIILYYDNSTKFQTTSAGVTVTGIVTATGGTSTEWNTAYDDSITAISDSGSSTITLTLTQQDAGTLTTSFSNPQGTVTGVTATAPVVSSGGTAPVISVDTAAVSSGSSKLATGVQIQTAIDTAIANVPSGLSFEGNWNASTDSPALQGTTPANGVFYIVSVAGSTDLSGITDWVVGDWAVYVSDGAGTDAWQKVDNTSTLSGSGVANRIAYWSGTSTLVSDADHYVDGDTIFSTNLSASTSVNAGTQFVVGNLTLTQNELDVSSGALTIDTAGTLKLDSGDSEIHLLGGGTSFGKFFVSGSTFYINQPVADQDIWFSGTDDSSSVVALKLDMSEAGDATFNRNANFSAEGKIYLGGSTARMHVYHTGSGGEATVLTKEGNLNLVNQSHGDDIVFKTEDSGGAVIQPLILYSGGNATFASDVDITGGALSISADGSNKATFTESGSGDLTIEAQDDIRLDSGGNDIVLRGASSAEFGRLTNVGGNFKISTTGYVNIDAADDITLDAGGNDIRLFSAGVEFGKFKSDSSDLALFSSIQDKDILFNGNDGGSTITALQLDMSNGGSATFRDDIDYGGKLTQTGTGNNTFAGNITGVTATLTGTESLMLTLNPTANSYGGIWFKYDGVSKGMSVYNSGSMVYGGESGVGTKLQTDGATALEIDTSQNATFAGAIDIRGTAYDQIKIASNLTADTNKLSGIYTENYEGNNVSIFQTFTQDGNNTIYYGSADGAYAGMQNHRFYVNADSDTPASGHTEALHIASNTNATFAGKVNINDNGGLYFNVNSGSQSDIASFKNDNGSIVLGYAGSLASIDLANTSQNFRLRQGANVPLYIDSDMKATFAGDVAFEGDILTDTDSSSDIGKTGTRWANLWVDSINGSAPVIAADYLALAGGTMTGNTIHNDDVKDIYGTGSDGLEIYHSGSDSYIRDTGTGSLRMTTNRLTVLDSANSETMIDATQNAGVLLYYNNVNVLETVALGAQSKFDGGGNAIGYTIHNEGTAAGDDVKIAFETQAAMDYAIGIDKSDSNSFKISRSENLGTNDAFIITSTHGAATFKNTLTVENAFGVDAGTGNNVGGISWGGTDDGFLFAKSGNTTKVYLNSAGDSYFTGGDVGIGNSNPLSKLSIDSNGVPIFTAAQMATTGLTIHNGTGGTAIQIGTYDAGSYNYIQSGYINSASTARELRFYNGNINSLKLSTTGGATFSGGIIANEGITVDGIYIQNNTIAHSGGDITLDAGGDIILDAADNQIFFKDNGTQVGTLTMTGGDLKLISDVDDKDMIFAGQDGVSEVVALTLDMSEGGNATFGGSINLADSKYVYWGGANDFYIGHAVTETNLINSTGHLNIEQHEDDADIYFRSDNGTGGTTAYFYLDGSETVTRFPQPIRFEDSTAANWGASSDLRIYHNATDSHIDNYTGNLNIVNNTDDGDIQFYSDDGAGGVAVYFRLDGSKANVAFSKNIVLDGDAQIELDVTPGSGNASGTIIKIWSTSTTYGLCYALREPGAGTGQWEEATVEEDDTYIANLIAIAVGTNSVTDGMLTEGIFYKSGHGFNIGVPLYVAIDGGLSASAPTGSGEYVRVAGYAISDDEIYFNPDGTWILLD